MQINIISNHQCGLGEGAYWHPAAQKFYWLDIKYHQLHAYDPNTKQFQQWQLPGLVGAACAMKNGHFIIGFEQSIAEYDPHTDRLTVLFESHSGHRMNDGFVDPAGRFWIGEADDTNQSQARLYRYDPDGQCTVMEQGLTISNGLDWDLKRKRFYLTDSVVRKIYVYDYDNVTGAITHRRDFVTATPDDGYPDGMVLDADGYVWSCFWEGHKIVRYTPDGAVDRVIAMPVARPTKCAFGGADLKTLLITSASSNVTSDELLAKPNGYVFSIELDVAGRAATLFG